MSYRLTNNDKWNDDWFNSLSPHAKLLFMYICDNCDNAGFYLVNMRFLIFHLGITEDELRIAFSQLKKSYVISDDKTIIWLKNFLKHQKRLPLNTMNNAHKEIIRIIETKMSESKRFSENKILITILNSTVKSSKSTKSKKQSKTVQKRAPKRSNSFVKPSVQDIFEYMSSKDFSNAEREATSFFDYNESIGWKVGHKPMVNWKNAVNTWIQKRIKPINSFKKPSQQEVIDYMKSMDFSPAQTEGIKFYNWFESNGWKVGKNYMVSWQNSANSWISNWYERNKITNKSSKIDILKQSHDLLKDVDWNQVYQ